GAAPLINVTVDGRAAGDVTAMTGFGDLETFLDIAPGSHTLGVTLTNYVKDGGLLLLRAPCDRSVFLDTVTVKPSPGLFAPDSWRNRTLPDTQPIDPDSAAYVAELRREVQTTGATVNATWSSTPVYVAPVQTPTRQVQVDSLSDPWHAAHGSIAEAL